MQKHIAALTLGGLFLLSTPAWSSEGWVEDFDEAVKIAKAQNKDLLVDFTGSDWCKWCIKLDEEVFSHEEFTKGVKDNYVLVSLDFPRKEENIAKVHNRERNLELQKEYEVRGFPTILLMNSDGLVYGKTGYQPGGPENYVEHINEIREAGREAATRAHKALTDYEAATEGEAKIAALGTLLSAMIDLKFSSPLSAKLIAPARTALTLDPKNEKGLKLRAVHALSNAAVHDAELLGLAKELDPENKAGAYELQINAMFQTIRDEPSALRALGELDALNAFTFQDKNIGFLMNFTAANWNAGPMSNLKGAKKYATIAKQIGSSDKTRMDFLAGILEKETTPPVDK